jgi:hypothetical protein
LFLRVFVKDKNGRLGKIRAKMVGKDMDMRRKDLQSQPFEEE